MCLVTRVEVLDLCYDFESRASAALQVKFRGREGILSEHKVETDQPYNFPSKSIEEGQNMDFTSANFEYSLDSFKIKHNTTEISIETLILLN